MGAMLSGLALHTKEKTWHLSQGFSTKFDIFQKIFLKALRAKMNIMHCRAHEKQGKNIKSSKNIANIIVQYKGIAQCFLAQQLGQQ